VVSNLGYETHDAGKSSERKEETVNLGNGLLLLILHLKTKR